MFKLLTSTEIHLSFSLDLLLCLSLNHFKVLIKRNMDVYCKIKIFMYNTKDKVNVLQIKTDMLTIPLK